MTKINLIGSMRLALSGVAHHITGCFYGFAYVIL